MNTAEIYTLVSEIATLAALSNLGMDESPLDKLVEIFERATKAKAIIDVAYEAEYTALVRKFEARQEAMHDAVSAGWGHD